DYHGDRFLYVFVTGTTNALYRNNGNGSFTAIPKALPVIGAGAAAWGDFDNDGKLDIVTAGIEANGSVTRLMRNNGDGTFTEVAANLPPLYGGSAEWGDFDNDGDLD